jgi:alkylmercury lyase
MSQTNLPAVDRLWAALAPSVPSLTPEEQRAGIAVVHELALGDPVSPAQLAAAIGGTTAHAKELLERPGLKAFLYADEQGRVVGYLGLAATPMHHRFKVNGRTLWTWCAGDSLFLPGVLNETAEVESRDPESGALVRLTISPTRVQRVEPDGVVVSMVSPDAPDFTSAERIMKTACHYIYYFASRATGEQWVAKHPGTWLLSLDEAFEFGRRFREHMFATELARQSASVV